MEENPYVSFVSETTIRFTEEFKEIAYAGKQTGTGTMSSLRTI